MLGKSSQVASSPDIDPRDAPRAPRGPARHRRAARRGAASRDPPTWSAAPSATCCSAQSRADLDVVVEGDVAPLADALGGELIEHDRFETATVALGDARRSTSPARARRPTTQPGRAARGAARPTIEEDLARRDFTINAMARAARGRRRADRPPRRPRRPAGRGCCASCTTAPSSTTPPGRCARRATPRASTWTLEPEHRAAAARGRPLDRLGGPGRSPSWREIAAEERPSAALALIDDWGLLDLGNGRRALAAAIERLLRRAARAGTSSPTAATTILAAVAPGDHPARLRAAAPPSSPSTRRPDSPGPGPGARPRPRPVRARDGAGRRGRTGSTTTSTACATSSSRSTATT